MAKKKTVEAAVPDDDWRLRHSFDFKPGEEPDGFKDLDLDDEVTIVIKGKVTGLNKDKDYNDKNRYSLSVRRSSVTIAKAGKVLKISEALEKDRSKRRL